MDRCLEAQPSLFTIPHQSTDARIAPTPHEASCYLYDK